MSDTGNGNVLEFNGTTGTPVGTGIFVHQGSAGLGHPLGLTFGSNGNLFVGNDNGAVLEFNGTTGMPVGTGIFVPAGSAGQNDALSLAFGPDGNLFVVSRSSREVLEFNGATGAPVGSGVFVPPGSLGLEDPLSLAFGPNGNLFVGNLLDSRGLGDVLEYDGSTGSPVGVFVPTGSAGLVGPNDLAFSPPATPEPTSVALLGSGIVVLAGSWWCKKLRASRQFPNGPK